jgi:branched-chain amino acid transport system ATP-binding protein
MLCCSEWTAGWTRTPVFENWNVLVRDAEIVTILGTNGVGKTTFMRSILGGVPCCGGSLEIDGVRRAASDRRAKEINRKIAYVPEGRGILTRLTVRENLILGYRGERRTKMTRIEELLAVFPALLPLLDRRAGFLSGGEQQMLAIARGLMSRPQILLLDEPTLGLAPIMLQRIVESLRAMRSNLSVLVAEQNLPFSLAVSDRLYVVSTDGSMREIRTDAPHFRELVTAAYLGAGTNPLPSAKTRTVRGGGH